MYVLMEVDHVSGSEPDEEDWENVDEVRRRSTCYSWEMMGHFARDCKRTGKGEKGGDGSKGYAKGEGNDDGRRREERAAQGMTFGRIEKLEIPGTSATSTPRSSPSLFLP